MIDKNYYGINVAKVKEIMTYRALTPIPNGHPNLEGAFSTRGETVSVVNLASVLACQRKKIQIMICFLLLILMGAIQGFIYME